MPRFILPVAPARPGAGRAPPFARGAGERLRLRWQTALVLVQVAWFTLLGWLGSALALLPLALRGAPRGRRLGAQAPAARQTLRLLTPLRRRGLGEAPGDSAGSAGP